MKEIIKKFQQYLKNKKLTKVSVKNYVSDTRQFLKWTAKNNFNHLDGSTFSVYKSHLISQKTPPKSINRYLTSLRRLGKFLKEEKITMFNPAAKLENIRLSPVMSRPGLDIKHPELTLRFKEALRQEKLKPATIKNYVSDSNQFLKWLKGRKI